MTGKRRIGTVATGLTAALALLTGLAAASADELSDLRDNQQQLQQRLDRLSAGQPQAVSPQAPAPGSPNPDDTAKTSDSPLLGGSFPRSFVIPGTSTSVRVGGSVDESFGYHPDR